MDLLASIRRSDLSRLRRPAGFLLLAAALWFTWRLVASLSWRDLGHRMADANATLLVLALACLIGRYFLWDRRLAIATDHAVQTSPRIGVPFFVLLASAALNLITPSARVVGGLVRARYIARSLGKPLAPLYGVILYDQLAHYVVMTSWTGFALVLVAWLLGRPGLGAAAVVAYALLAGLAVAAVTWAGRGSLGSFFARRAERTAGRGGSMYGHGHEAARTLETLVAERRLRLPALLLGIGFFLISALAQWLVFAALGRAESFVVVLAVVALGASAGMLTGTPGGAGTTEAAMVALFGALGVAPGEAAAATLLSRGLHYGSILALGVPALVALELKYGVRRGGAVPTDDKTLSTEEQGTETAESAPDPEATAETAA